jgi:hypothetical protein
MAFLGSEIKDAELRRIVQGKRPADVVPFELAARGA